MTTTAITLSPAFKRARTLSRIMWVLFTIAFCLMLIRTVYILRIPFAFGPEQAAIGDIPFTLLGLSTIQRIWVMLTLELTVIPVLLLMHHARAVFGHFAKGEIFVSPVISHIRRAGLCLMGAFFAEIAGQVILKALGLIPHGQGHATAATLWPLFIGAVTFIAAYVMEEAKTIAADHAEIV